MLVPTVLALFAAQAATPPANATADPGAAIRTAAIAFSTCVRTKIAAVPASLTPEQGADGVLAACKAEQAALEGAAGAQIALAPPDAQAAARQQLTDGMAQARTGIAKGIVQMRAAQSAPAPAASPTPAPR